jgi:GNAT superfamily N-acetyltransferase
MDTIVPILLLPEHVRPNSSSLPVLKAIQRVLNESYTTTYCAYPEIFGTRHVRMADPAQLADIIGTEGFTIVLVRVTSAGAGQKRQFCEVVATGSVKDFGDGDVETYAQWSKNLSGTQWTTKAGNQERSGATTERSKEGAQKLEVTAFAVSPHYQARGLGGRLLNEIKWLVTARRLQGITTNAAPMVEGLGLSDSASTSPLEGIDLNRLKYIMSSVKTSKSDQVVQDTTPKLVLMAIRELGNEAYYQKRGFRTVWSGTVPVGMWDCRKDCTMVYMETDLD